MTAPSGCFVPLSPKLRAAMYADCTNSNRLSNASAAPELSFVTGFAKEGLIIAKIFFHFFASFESKYNKFVSVKTLWQSMFVLKSYKPSKLSFSIEMYEENIFLLGFSHNFD